MFNQEDYVKMLDLHRQGWTSKEIAAELGSHPATIASWLKSDAADAESRARCRAGDERRLAAADRPAARGAPAPVGGERLQQRPRKRLLGLVSDRGVSGALAAGPEVQGRRTGVGAHRHRPGREGPV